MRPTIIIGDIHGRTVWKDIVSSFDGYRFFFLGDYLDPYERMPRKHLIDNLKDIISFKQDNMENVVLLLGNHDLHYITSDMDPCSRFDIDIAEEASKVFLDNYDLFQFAFQDGNALFTHAGVNHEWFVEDFRGDLRGNIAGQLNNPTDRQVASLCRAGERSRMYDGQNSIEKSLQDAAKTNASVKCPKTIGGIFWASESEIKSDPLHGYTQYVGHSRIADRIVCHKVWETDSTVWFCDCLEFGVFGIED